MKQIDSNKLGTDGTGVQYPPSSHTHVRTREAWGLDYDNDLAYVSDNEVVQEGSDPIHPLPTFFSKKGREWPLFIQRIVDKGRTVAQRDILLLGALNVFGATLGPKVRTLYDGKWISPCMMLFVVAPPASGKGVLAWLRQIVKPYHDELRREYNVAYEDYLQKKARYNAMGKERVNASREDIPEAPLRKFFIIPANNSGTGIQANLIHSGGRGIIFQTEADTLTTALETDYGHFSDMLRNTFDHEGISFYRRTDDECKEIDATYLSILLSGTPDQVKALIKSYNNGLASRFLFYYMPPVLQWQSQFDRKEDMNVCFKEWAEEWKGRIDSLKTVDYLTFELTKEQQQYFDTYMGMIFDRGQHSVGLEVISSVIRIGPQLLRIMSIVGLMRCWDRGEGLMPASDIPTENIRDGICTRYTYGISMGDFLACLMMSEPLFSHAIHILSLLPIEEVTNRGSADKEALFSKMGAIFERREFLEKAEEMGIKENTAQQWLKRALKRRQIVKIDPGVYQFVHTIL